MDARPLEQFGFSPNRRIDLSSCFHALSYAKPLRTFAGNALAEDQVALLVDDLASLANGLLRRRIFARKAVGTNEAVLLQLAIHLPHDDATGLKLPTFLERRCPDYISFVFDRIAYCALARSLVAGATAAAEQSLQE